MFLSFCVFNDFFCFSKNSEFWVFFVHPETTLPDGLKRPMVEGRIANFDIFLDVFEFLRIG